MRFKILETLHQNASHFILKCLFIKLSSFQLHHIPDFLVVKIPVSHLGRPGSITGLETLSNTT